MIFYVAYIDNSLSGGSIRVLETLLKKMSEKKIDFRVIFIYQSPGLIYTQYPDKCFYLNAKPGKGYRSLFKFLKIYGKYKPEIIHLIDPIYWLQILMFFLNTKSFFHIHGAHWNNNIKYKLKFYFLISKVCIDRFITITHGAKDQLVENFSVNKNRIDILYNSVDLNKIHHTYSDNNIKSSFGIPANSKIIGSVGRVVQARGFEDLVRLLVFLDDSWHALIIGDGEYKNELISLANELNISNRVHFTGFVDNVIPYYKIFDIYGFFARYESFGLALADAMLYKVPIFGLKGAGEYYDKRNPLVTFANSTFIERPFYLDQWRKEDNETILKLANKIKDFDRNRNEFFMKTEIAYEHVSLNFNSELQYNHLMSIYKK